MHGEERVKREKGKLTKKRKRSRHIQKQDIEREIKREGEKEKKKDFRSRILY